MLQFIRIAPQFVHVWFILLMVSLPLSKGLASVAIVALLILSIVKCLQQAPSWHIVKKYKAILACSFIFIAYLLGMLYTENVQAGWRFTYIQNSFLITPFIALINRALLKQYFNQYLTWLITASAFACVVTIVFNNLSLDIVQEVVLYCNNGINYLLGNLQMIEYLGFLKPDLVEEYAKRFGWYSPFIDRLHFSYIISLSVLSTLWLLSRANVKPLQKSGLIIAMVLLFSTLLLLGARGAQLGMAIALSVWLVMFYKRFIHASISVYFGKKASVITLVGLLLGSLLLTPYVVYTYVPSVKKRYYQMYWELEAFYLRDYKKFDYTHFTSIRRIISWQHNITLVVEHPIKGVGTGDFRQEMQRLYDADAFKFSVNAHNQFLYIWASVGIGGLALFVGFMIFWWYRLHGTKHMWLSTFSGSILVFYGFIMLLDAPLIGQSGNMPFCIALCFLGSWAIETKPPINTRENEFIITKKVLNN